MVASERIDAVEYHATGDPMVAMPAMKVRIRPLRALRDDQPRTPLADLPCDVQPELTRVLHFPVLVAEEENARDTEDPGRAPLLLFANSRQSFRRDRAIGGALVSVGHDDVGDLAPLLDEVRDRARRAALRLVRMRGHHHDPVTIIRHRAPLSASCSRPEVAGTTTRPPRVAVRRVGTAQTGRAHLRTRPSPADPRSDHRRSLSAASRSPAPAWVAVRDRR